MEKNNLTLNLSLPANTNTAEAVDYIVGKIKDYNAGILIKSSLYQKLIWNRKNEILTTESGMEIKLGWHEQVIFRNLAKNLNDFMSNSDLISSLKYSGYPVTESTLRVHIHRLRKKLLVAGEVIITQRNVGISLRDIDGRIIIE